VTSPEPTDEILMLAYIDGDQEAFRMLFQRYTPILLRLLRRGLSIQEQGQIQDLLQQTFLQLHRARNDFRKDATLRPWLITIALNLKREYLRKAKRLKKQESLTGEEYIADREHPLERAEEIQLMRRQLHMLPEKQREVIELHWYEELSFPEIAKLLGTSVSAVKVRAHRGYKTLRARYQSFKTS